MKVSLCDSSGSPSGRLAVLALACARGFAKAFGTTGRASAGGGGGGAGRAPAARAAAQAADTTAGDFDEAPRRLLMGNCGSDGEAFADRGRFVGKLAKLQAPVRKYRFHLHVRAGAGIQIADFVWDRGPQRSKDVVGTRGRARRRRSTTRKPKIRQHKRILVRQKERIRDHVGVLFS